MHDFQTNTDNVLKGREAIYYFMSFYVANLKNAEKSGIIVDVMLAVRAFALGIISINPLLRSLYSQFFIFSITENQPKNIIPMWPSSIFI